MNYDKDYVPRPVDGLSFESLTVPRHQAIDMGCCARCGGEAEVFADYLSEREYHISGFCQRCQDQYYASLEREDPYEE